MADTPQTPDGLLGCQSCPSKWRMPARYMATPKRINGAPSATDWPLCEGHMQHAMIAGWFPIEKIEEASSAPQEPDDAEVTLAREDANWLRHRTEPLTMQERRNIADRLERIANRLQTKAPETDWPADAIFQQGAQVKKKGRASWRGTVVGWYRTELTALGLAVESTFEPGSVQIYPQSALEAWRAPETGEE